MQGPRPHLDLLTTVGRGGARESAFLTHAKGEAIGRGTPLRKAVLRWVSTRSATMGGRLVSSMSVRAADVWLLPGL